MENINPSTDVLLHLINLLQNKKYNEAIVQTKKLLITFKKSFHLYNFLGLVYANRNNSEKAITYYKKSIELNNEYPDAYNNLGLTYSLLGNIKLAKSNFEKAISLNDNFTLAYTNLAKLFYLEMDYSRSFICIHKSLLINPNYLESMILFKNLLCLDLIFHKNDIFFYSVIINLITKFNIVQPRKISLSVTNLLKKDPSINKLLNLNDINKTDLLHTLKILNQNNLLIEFIKICPLSDNDFENLLKSIRKKTLLFNFSVYEYKEVKNFIIALSEQCFLNEYIYDVSLEEKNKISEIEKKIINNIYNDKANIEIDLTKLSLYKNLSNSILLSKIDKNIFNDFIKKIQLEFLLEKNLKKEIPKLSITKNPTSNLVKKQYEENPYPRWSKPAFTIEPLSVENFFRKIDVKLSKLDYKLFESPEILIAGCGTGQHSLNTSATFKDSNVTAIDLSLNSLAYAKRKCLEFKIKNINFVQSDLLNLELLNKKFDIIESVGVIHHMKNPSDGLKILVKILKDGGLIELGLYSELGRRNILKFRKDYMQNKEDYSIENLKFNRKIIKDSDNSDIKTIIKYNDFYTLSEFRDMIFHVQEHNFNISRIIELLEHVGLTFCGFSNLSKHILKKANINSDGLNKFSLSDWENIERDYPDIFSGMYQFWCQK